MVIVLCVCPFVCLSQAGIVSKWMNIGSRKQRHLIARGLWLSAAKNIVKIRTGPFLRRRQMQAIKAENRKTLTYVPCRVDDTK